MHRVFRRLQHTQRTMSSSSRSLPYAHEKQVALRAVQRACVLTASVFNHLVKNETLTKGDKSPVTGQLPLSNPIHNIHIDEFMTIVADFSAQAVVNTILAQAFPSDPIVGEEDTGDLRKDDPAAHLLKERVVALSNDALAAYIGEGDAPSWKVGPGQKRSAEELLDAIDRGNYEGGKSGRSSPHSARTR
jgi:3'(2'), 5'-bisphosphate nucleotidase